MADQYSQPDITAANNPLLTNSQSGFKGFSGFSGFGGMQGFGGSNPDLNTASGLLDFANQQGGMIAQQANSLANPTTGILSTISDGAKNAFGGFIKAISLPSNIVAGIIDPNKSIGQAIDEGERPSEAIFGKQDANATTMQKVGGFLVRTATDILLDPLTYVTFGAGQGILGLRATSEITLGGEAATKMGIEEGGKAALSGTGQELYKGLKNIENIYKTAGVQAAGTAMGEFLKTGDVAYNVAGTKLQELLAQSLDLSPKSQQAIDFTKKALSQLLTAHPHLTETFLDQGGLKLFGKTVIAGARMSSAIRMIPGMTTIDEATKPVRNMVTALFDPNLQKVGKEYVRLPEEYSDLRQAAADLTSSLMNATHQDIVTVAKAAKLNTSEVDIVRAAVEARKMPADPRLAKAYLDILGIDSKQFKEMQFYGLPVSYQDQHAFPHVSVQDDTPIKSIPFKTPPAVNTGALKQASLAKFIEQGGEGFKPLGGLTQATAGEVTKSTGEGVLEQVPKEMADLQNIKNGTSLLGKISSAKSVQEAGVAVGEHLNQTVKSLVDSGHTYESALQHPDVTTLMNTRNAIDALPQSKQLVGNAENFGLKSLDEAKGIYVDPNGVQFKRMAAGLDELAAQGFKGFEMNPFIAHYMRSTQNVKSMVASHFMSDLATSFGKIASEAPRGFVPIEVKGVNDAVAKVFGNVMAENGEQVLFHPAIAANASQMVGQVINDEPTKDILKAFDKLQGIWKASVTSIFPAFHGRNALTHVLLNTMDLGVQAFNPLIHSTAAQYVWQDMKVNGLMTKAAGIGEDALGAKNDLADMLKNVMFTDNTGKDWTFGEIRQMVKDKGVAFGDLSRSAVNDVGLSTEDVKAGLGATSKAKDIANKVLPISQNFAPFEWGREAGSALANQARMVNFISNLKNTGDVELAAARTKQFLFDYGNLTNFEKTFARRLIPFYTFTRKNLELQAQSLMTTPGRVAAEVSGLQNLGDTISGNNKLSPAEEAALPDWIKAGIYSVTSKKGEDVNVQSGFASPIEQPFAALQPNAILGSLSPIIRVPMEQATGYSFFQGKPLSQITNATAFQSAPDFIKNLIGYTTAQGVDSTGNKFTYYVSLRPQMMNLILNLPPTSRVFSALKQIQTADPSNQAKVMEQLIGTHPYSFNLTVEAQRQENVLKRQLEDLLTSAHVTASYSRVFVPKK